MRVPPTVSDQPNPFAVGLSVLRSQRVRRPSPKGSGSADHRKLGGVLDVLAADGLPGVARNLADLEEYVGELDAHDPDRLDATGAQAYWLNLYNAGALLVAARAHIDGAPSVLRTPGGFSRPWVEISGERLSLDDIEHGKVRRFGDPRIHAALVCGSVSCPTLRFEPYEGDRLDEQLDDQMRSFVASGAVVLDPDRQRISMSRIFLWYGRDFTHPHHMPSVGIADADLVRDTVAFWLPGADREAVWEHRPSVEFQEYDWGLACTVA